MIWIQDIVAGQSFQPRILFNAGCQVQEITGRKPPHQDLVGFKIINLGGQLRWNSGTGDVIGDFSFPHKLEYVKSADYPSEQIFKICCDVPHHILSRLEIDRKGEPPILWVDLCGSWAIDGGIEPIFLTPWKLKVPTEVWDSFLADSGYYDYDVIGLRRVMKEGNILSPAIAHLNVARGLVSSDPTGAVAKCRYVIEAIEGALKDKGYQKTSLYLITYTDKYRGEQYSRILSAIKQLASLPHHDYGKDSQFTSAESNTVLKLCETLLELLDELSRSSDILSNDTIKS
ncbi:MAG: hypothetical protein OXE59_07630 [Bacteroidetes bacterium]|nr:hypothetical protein [Bacteroidota bacterium]